MASVVAIPSVIFIVYVALGVFIFLDVEFDFGLANLSLVAQSDLDRITPEQLADAPDGRDLTPIFLFIFIMLPIFGFLVHLVGTVLYVVDVAFWNPKFQNPASSKAKVSWMVGLMVSTLATVILVFPGLITQAVYFFREIRPRNSFKFA